MAGTGRRGWVRVAAAAAAVLLLPGCLGLGGRRPPEPPRLVELTVTGEGEDARALCATVGGALAARLRAGGLQVNPPAVQAWLAVHLSTEAYNPAGGYWAIESEAELTLRRSDNGRRLGSERVLVKGGRRLGRAEAVQSLAAELSAVVANLGAGLCGLAPKPDAPAAATAPAPAAEAGTVRPPVTPTTGRVPAAAPAAQK